MKRKKGSLKLLLTFVLSIAVLSGCSAGTAQTVQPVSAEAEDSEKEEVSVESRIIATSAATAHIMDRLGIDLVGVSAVTISTLPERYSDVTQVGTAMAPDLEIIKSLNPTDVIGPDTLEGDLRMKYDEIGIDYSFINLRSVEGMYASIALLGEKYNRTEEAKSLIDEYEAYMADYKERNHTGEPPRVLVLMGLPGSYLVATDKSYAGSLVNLAGGENVFPHDTKDFLILNTEEILQSNPDVIIRTAHGLPFEALKMFEAEFEENDIWKHFTAVQEGRVHDVDYMIFGMSATFEYTQALEILEPLLFEGR